VGHVQPGVFEALDSFPYVVNSAHGRLGATIEAVSDAAFELSLNEVGEHIADLRRAARDGNVVYLTEGGRRLAAVVPSETEADVTPGRRRLATVSGVLPGFEFDVDVEASRDSWERR
jgi:hypothetical protein